MRLAGRRILITGAASGIGRETARLFRAEGAAVALLDRDAARLEAAEAELGGLPGPALAAVAADVGEAAAVDSAVAAAALALGGLDGLVGAAGIDLLRPFAEMSAADWEAVMAVNLAGPFHVSRALLPYLRAAGGGTIVHIASGAALRPLPGRTAYCAAKAGLVMFAKALAVDLAADGIRVNAVCPGIVDTPLFRQSIEQAADPPAALAQVLDRYLIKQVGRPVDIAYAALYLSSAESAQVTGSALAVDGGRVFH